MKKANKHIIKSYTDRVDRVRAFLTSFKPNLEYDIVVLKDVCGPTAVDPDIQGLVVSKETLSGAAASLFILSTLSLVDSNSEFAHSRQKA